MVGSEGKKVITLLTLSICFILFLIVYSVHAIKEDYFDAIGTRASSIALVIADHIQLRNEEVDRLINLNYNDLLNDRTNKEFEEKVRKYMDETDTKYIYLMHRLPPEQIKYHVENHEINYYYAPAGTALDTVYLLDAVIDEQTRMDDTDGKWYRDKDRYTYLKQKISDIYERKEVTHTIYNDQWGSYISGFAPVYSVEGNYIGILGVDIYIDEYISLVCKRIIIILIFNIIMTVVVFTSIKKMYQTKSDAEYFKKKSYFDDMTGFFNRRTLRERGDLYWKKAIEDNMTVSVMMIDIDFFKSYNDKYGHMIGDQMISKVASVIKLCTRDHVDLLFRYGGDEFMILFFNTKVDAIKMIAKRITEHVNGIVIEEVDENVTLSIGIAYANPKEGSSLTELIHEADQALYRSKESGRDAICVSDYA